MKKRGRPKRKTADMSSLDYPFDKVAAPKIVENEKLKELDENVEKMASEIRAAEHKVKEIKRKTKVNKAHE